MIWPPTLMHLRIKNDRSRFGLWLPIFLLFPLALALLVLFSPIIVFGLIITWPSGWGLYALKVFWGAVTAFCAMRGLKVDVRTSDNQLVYISLV